MIRGRTYREYVTPRWETLQCDASRAIFGGTLTPLPEVVAPTITRLPGDIGAQLTRDFWKRHGTGGDWGIKHAAQDWLAAEVSEFEREKIHRAFDEHEIRALASRWSDLCRKMLSIEPMQEFGRSVGIEPPEVKGNVSRVGVARRMACPRWWRRQIRKHYTRRAESHLRAVGFVHRRRQVFASDRAVELRRSRKARDRAMLQEMVAVSDAGDQLELWSVVEKSQANPALRRAELMTRLRGFEEVALLAGHSAEFVTLTCPSAMHRTLDNGQKNPLWQGATPREGQQWLCKMWARARAKLKRLKVMFYGFRIAEPHHDGTPHWHAVLFVADHNADTLRAVIGSIWLSEYGDEHGAKRFRSKFIKIDPAKGSACGYVAKYISKNIDGFEVGEDFEAEKPAHESCDRVAAWASAHGIRQFQQIGGPSVTTWRELRRIRTEVSNHPAIEAARKAADAGEWSQFVTALGGIEVGRAGGVTIWQVWSDKSNQYDEPKGFQVAGVQAVEYSTVMRRRVRRKATKFRVFTRASLVPCVVAATLARVRTREKVWRVQRKTPEQRVMCARAGSTPAPVSSLGPVSITVRDLRSVPAGGVAGSPENQPVRGPPWMH